MSESLNKTDMEVGPSSNKRNSEVESSKGKLLHRNKSDQRKTNRTDTKRQKSNDISTRALSSHH